MQSQHLIEKFVRVVCEEFPTKFVPVSFLPWTVKKLYKLEQGRALAPPIGSDVLDEEEIQRIRDETKIFLCGCTFTDPAEVAAAVKVLEQLVCYQDACVLVAHLVPSDFEATFKYLMRPIQYLDQIFAAGVADVLVGLDLNNASEFYAAAEAAVAGWESSIRRRKLTLESKGKRVTLLGNQQQHLLEKSCPHTLIPRFPICNYKVEETSTSVSKYRFVGYFPTLEGHVVKAYDRSQNDKMVVVKVLDKSWFFMPGEVEAICRELRFNSEMLRHPNLPQCLDALHTNEFFYVVFEHAGEQNLVMKLLNFANHRFGAIDALDCFKNIVAGLAYCHSNYVAHRNLTLEHIAIKVKEDGKYHCTLLNFRTAMLARRPSSTLCGTPPYLAPETMAGAYSAIVADCWSVGIILLEIAGGLGSTYKALNCNRQGLKDALPLFFREVGCHRRALTVQGATFDSTICKLLEMLLQLEVPRRATMAATGSFLTIE